MVVQVLTTDTVAMCSCIVTPAKDARVWHIGREEVTQPLNTICSRPGLVVISVQSMDGNDTAMNLEQALTTTWNNLLYDWLVPFRHHFETVKRFLNILLGLGRYSSLLLLSAADEVASGFWHGYRVCSVALEGKETPKFG